MTQSNTELADCPFCGSAAETDKLQAYRAFDSGTVGTRSAIYCTSCDADMGYCHEDHSGEDYNELDAELAAAWNRRASSGPGGGGCFRSNTSSVRI